MLEREKVATTNRLPAQMGEAIDRAQTVRLTFDGREHRAYAGDTIASALAAAGMKVFSRSFKYHRPRGLLCCSGDCPNCLVQVGDEPNVRACQRVVADGMRVVHQNAWPSLEYDLMSLSQMGSRLLPVGFYYKTFIHPTALWPTYERVLRQAAGLGEVHRDTPSDEYDKQFLHADVAVIGGGPAGLSAARAAAERGARVLLFDENPTLGGHLRYTGTSDLSGLQDPKGLAIFTNTTVLGVYQDNWLAAVSGARLFKVRARSIVVATGAVERPLPFANNDLPGVMLGSAVQRLLNLYRVAPWRRALVVTANDDGWAVAADLRAAGVQVMAIVDEREASATTHTSLEDVPVLWQHNMKLAHGRGAVSHATVAHVNAPHETRTFNCDLIAISIGWTPANDLAYQAGAQFQYDEARAEHRPTSMPAGVYLVGRAAGTHDIETQIGEGRWAGLSAAAFVGCGDAPSIEEHAALTQRKRSEPPRSSAQVGASGHKKQFICFCEDVTSEDIETSITEGYDSLELLKRYSTVTMGPCQGKMCALNAIHLCARANRWSVQETGTTTTRPPTQPVTLGSLAGQHMEPVQVTPTHEWHIAHGARMMVAAVYLRPFHYGDPTAEVKAVRERVGLIDVSTLGKLRLTGAGVPNFLERIYINQWRNLGVGRVRYGVMCNDEGIVLDDGVCAHLDAHEWYMTTTSSGAGAIYEWLQWYRQSGWGEGVRITDVTEAFAAFNLAGPHSRRVLQKLTALDLSNEAIAYMHVREAEVAGVPCRLLRIGFTGELSYEIHAPASYGLHLWERLMEAGEEFGIAPFGVEAQRVLRLEKGHIIVGQDTDALSDALSADLGWAVKLSKPDFLGKRALMRVAKEGPKQRLVGFKMAQPNLVPDEGLQIVRPSNGKLELIGQVTSSRRSPTLGEVIGLCWLPAELAAQNGATFTICMDAKTKRLAEARVHHGAFYDAQGERLRA